MSVKVTDITKVNEEQLNANKSLSAELERYKERVELLEERQNIDLSTREKLIIDDVIKEKNAQFADFDKEINFLKQTLYDQLQEKESLTKTLTVLKNEAKEKEARNIDREIVLEKNWITLAQQIRPMLYDGDVIAKVTNVIYIPDSEETLILAEESRSKMNLKQSDPDVEKRKIKPVDYAVLNQLSIDFSKRFVPQSELSAEQAFCSLNSMTSLDPSLIVDPLKLRDEIIPFVKALKDLFNTFDQYLIDELSEVQNVLHQMEQAVEQHRLESKTFEIKMNQVLYENDRLLDQVMFHDIMHVVVNNSVNVNLFVAMKDYMNVSDMFVEKCQKCLELETELVKKDKVINDLSTRFSNLEKHCISLEVDNQLNQEIFQRENYVLNESAPTFDQFFELNDLKAQLQEKNTTIKQLKEKVKDLRKNPDRVKQEYDAIETINIELEHNVAKLLYENENLSKEIVHLKKIFKE
ncbi:hypothetical protein Tco_0846036 [Tanacetum coccineum]